MTQQRKPRELHPTYGRTKIEKWFRNNFHGYSPNLTGKKAITGRFTPSTKAKVSIRIKQILAIASKAKIGVMGDLESRMDKLDYRFEYSFVQRVYKTKSKELAREMEVYAINKFKGCSSHNIQNTSNARASRLVTYNGFYYVYVVYNI